MEEFLLSLTRGNLSEVKIVPATVVALLAVYQVGLMAVGYGTVRLPFPQPLPASKANRAIGDSIVAVTLVVAEREAAEEAGEAADEGKAGESEGGRRRRGRDR